ncbi:MAG: S8 family serine peptidase, partial [Streptosporangiaceae bacterium]|nr:S8 family serine peptidase [Streptosporangiaceae bacterium]
PPHLHGTFIASVIAGHGSGPGRTQGVMGVAPAARVLSVRVILDDGEPGLARYNNDPRFANAIAKGIYYAVSHGVRVINMSLGSPQPTRYLRTAVGYAISHGVVVVASAGNSGSAHGGFTPYEYPASYTGVISVAALNTNGARAPFSDRNASVVLSAPGVNVVGDGPGGEFVEGDGTSPAAAFVTGAVALIRSRYPALSPALVEQALITTARHRPKGGYSTSVGFGEVDAAAALSAAGRLAALTAPAGMAPAARFGPASPAPIQVTHRDQALIAGYSAVSAVAALCFLAAAAFGVLLGRRAVRDRRRAAATDPPWERTPPWEQRVPPPAGGTFLRGHYERGGPYGGEG